MPPAEASQTINLSRSNSTSMVQQKHTVSSSRLTALQKRYEEKRYSAQKRDSSGFTAPTESKLQSTTRVRYLAADDESAQMPQTAGPALHQHQQHAFQRDQMKAGASSTSSLHGTDLSNHPLQSSRIPAMQAAPFLKAAYAKHVKLDLTSKSHQSQ